jgi:hypothetical protein
LLTQANSVLRDLSCFVVITGRNTGTGTGAGILEKPAETAGVDTAGRYSVCLCAFFARLIKLHLRTYFLRLRFDDRKCLPN